MNISELYELTKWIDLEIKEKEVFEKYQALFTILSQNTQPNQPQQPLDTQKNDLIEILLDVDLSKLSTHQLSFLESLGIASAISNEGVSAIKDILYRNVIDIATSVQELQKISTRVQNGIHKSDQIRAGLSGCIFEKKESAEGALIRVTFQKDASMANLSDFKAWGNKWHEIGRGIAMAHGASPEDIRVTGATNGSIVLELATTYAIVKTTSAIILDVLKVAEKVLDIKKKVEEIRALKLDNDEAEKALLASAESEHDNGVATITEKFKTKLKLTKGNKGDKVTALEKAVKDLVEFIESGGDVDFVPTEDDEEDISDSDAAERQQLRTQFDEIRRLEKKVHAVEHDENVT